MSEQQEAQLNHLRGLGSENLHALLAELVTPKPLGCSPLFFTVAINKDFRNLDEGQLFDLVATVLKERIPTIKETKEPT